MKKLFVLLTGLSLTTAATAQTAWNMDKAHSSVNFSVMHMVVTEVGGSFKDFSADIKSDKPDFSDLTASFTIQAGSVSTDNEKRDGHLKSPDFFDADKFPTIAFKSAAFKKTGDGKYELEGDLTMKGVTKKVKWDVKYNGSVKDAKGSTHAGFKAVTTVNRQDYGVSWNKVLDSGGLTVSNDVPITVNLELVRK